jgi:predicted ATP-dependent serine protease
MRNVNAPYEGKRISVCQSCGLRTICTNGYCDRCRKLGQGVNREVLYDNKTSEEDVKKKEFKRYQELKKRETEELSDEEIAEILKKRTKIYSRDHKKGEVPESVDTNIKRNVGV